MGEPVCGWYLDIQPGGDLERSPGQLPGYGRRCSEKIWSGAYKRRCVWCQCHDACYMPFNKEGELMVPFRTWRNNITGEASEKLAELFHYNIPQRWSIAHLYQAILNGEEHVKDIDYITTLEAYVHWKLTGKRVLGIGDAAGMFPIDSETKDYNEEMVQKFDELVAPYGFPWKLRDIMPKALVAGQDAGVLTEEGAKLLDVSGKLKAGIPMCPPEGDAGTGMVATNSVRRRTGNVSAGTSVFAMIVLEKALSKPYKEIDMVTTPAGDPVAWHIPTTVLRI